MYFTTINFHFAHSYQMAFVSRVCPSCSTVFNKSDTEFCSSKCERRYGFKLERLRRAELFAKHSLTPKTCGLNSIPGESCGMYAYIAEEKVPDGNTTLTITEYCGVAHAAKGQALVVLDASVLQARALKLRLERYKAASAAKVKALTDQLSLLSPKAKL